jgi:hypothetical protein
MTDPADYLAKRHREGPGERVFAGADQATGESGGQRPERQRRRTVGQAKRRGGEDPAVDEPAVDS